MRHTDIDPQITRDLSALADESRRGLGDFAEVAALIESRQPAYRDERAGVEARRDALVKRRHLELALMPLSLERAFVHRVSRAAAGGVAGLCALALMVGLSQPILIRLADLTIPGRVTFTLGSVAIAAVILAGYVVGGWVAERVFERRMRESLEVSGDAHSDLDSLARGPIDRARELVRRADAWAIALPLVAVATLAPLMAFVTLSSFAFTARPLYSFSELAFLLVSTGDLVLLGLGMVAGVALAIAVGRACEREHKSLDRPRVLRVVEHVAVLPLAVVASLVLLGLLGNVVFDAGRFNGYIPEGTRLLLAVGGTLAVTGPAAWVLLWWRRREQRRLELA